MATATETSRPGARQALPRRRFRLLDAMILVAATALGCALLNGISALTGGEISWSSLRQEIGMLLRGEDPIGPLWGTIYLGLELLAECSPVVAMWGLALIPIRLIGARPRWRRLARQPGILASCALALAMTLIGSLDVFLGLVVGTEFDSGVLQPESTLLFSQMLIGMAVLAAWMALLLGGRWRAEPSWIDRVGRAIGAFWIISGLGMVMLLMISEASSGCRFRVQCITPPAAQGP